MNNEIITIITIAIAVGVIIGLPQLFKFRRAFLVPEGYAGLLYHKGKFVEVLRAGQHVRWGRKFTLGVADLRKTSLNVAGQEILTADNVGLKASLISALNCSRVCNRKRPRLASPFRPSKSRT
jgi:regulator of protease activity HflC (stomatin/prohibitin superfamily)